MPAQLEQAVRAVRPQLGALHLLAAHDDELVLLGGDEVLRLPLAPSAVQRLAVHVKALPELRARVPVALAPPRWVGVLPDGETPFTAEPRLPGRRPPGDRLSSIAASQLEGVVLALASVPSREARAWGVPGDGETLVHAALSTPALSRSALLVEGPRLTGITGWRLRLEQAAPGPLG